MDQPPPRLGEPPVRRLPQQIVGEIVMRGGGSPDDAVALQLLEAADQLRGGGPAHQGQHLGVERPPQGRCPGEQIAGAFSEPLQPFVEQPVERFVGRRRARGSGAGDLQRVERVALAGGERFDAVGGGVHGANQGGRLGRAQRLQSVLGQTPLPVQRPHHPQGRDVVPELAGPRGAGDQHPSAQGRPGQKMQQRRRRFVQPLHVVQDDRQRSVAATWANRCATASYSRPRSAAPAGGMPSPAGPPDGERSRPLPSGVAAGPSTSHAGSVRSPVTRGPGPERSSPPRAGARRPARRSMARRGAPFRLRTRGRASTAPPAARTSSRPGPRDASYRCPDRPRRAGRRAERASSRRSHRRFDGRACRVPAHQRRASLPRDRSPRAAEARHASRRCEGAGATFEGSSLGSCLSVSSRRPAPAPPRPARRAPSAGCDGKPRTAPAPRGSARAGPGCGPPRREHASVRGSEATRSARPAQRLFEVGGRPSSGAESRRQLGENRAAKAPQRLSFGHAPFVVAEAGRQIEALQRLAAKLMGGCPQALAGSPARARDRPARERRPRRRERDRRRTPPVRGRPGARRHRRRAAGVASSGSIGARPADRRARPTATRTGFPAGAADRWPPDTPAAPASSSMPARAARVHAGAPRAHPEAGSPRPGSRPPPPSPVAKLPGSHSSPPGLSRNSHARSNAGFHGREGSSAS